MDREDGQLSETVRSVCQELQPGPVSAQSVIQAVLRRHSTDYGHGKAATLPVDWPSSRRTCPIDEWVEGVRPLVLPDKSGLLAGRQLILGLALLEPAVGRPLEEAGVVRLLADDLKEPLLTVLTEAGVRALSALRLTAASEGQVEPRRLVDSLQVRPPGAVMETCAFSPDGIAATCLFSEDRASRVVVLAPARGRVVGSLADSGRIEAVALSSNVRRVATGDLHGVITLWDLARREALGKVKTPEDGGGFSALAFSPKGTFLAGAGRDGSISVWAVDRDGAMRSVGRLATGAVESLAFGGDELLAACEPGGTISLFDLPSVEKRVALPHGGALSAVTLGPETPDGRLCAAGGAGGVQVWNTRRGSQLASLTSTAPVRTLAFSHDGTRLATGDEAGVARLYSTRSWIELGRLHHGIALQSVVFGAGDTTLLTADGDAAVWRWEIGGPRLPRPLAGYHSDAAGGRDLIGIADDVDAFATLLAAETLAPPLSVGIFGEWGSGKTFFMRQLKERVAEIAAAARGSGKMQKEIPFYKRVVQVEFNAWHYSAGNVWAGLVEHIFANLRLHDWESEEVVARRTKPLLMKLTEAQRTAVAVTATVEQIKERNLQAENHLQGVKASHQRAVEQLAVAKAGALDVVRTVVLPPGACNSARDAVVQAGFEDPGEATGDVTHSLDVAREELEGGSAVLTALGRAPDRDRRLRWLLAALLAGPLLGLIIGLALVALDRAALGGVLSVATGAAAALAAVAQWTGRQAKWVSGRLQALETADRRVRQPLEQKREELARQQLQAEAEIQRLDLELQEARQQKAAAEADVQRAEADVEGATPANLLARLIEDRAGSGDYRRHLGLLALIREDFSDIADLLEQDRKQLKSVESLVDEAKDDDERINRIVLYVDDLDRVEPKIVVEVLQAVHLLLSFPIFVVVVGVDARWVSHALKERHPQLASGGATPYDYLEKIFQVPFWLEGLTIGRTESLVRGLLDPDGSLRRKPGPVGDRGELPGGEAGSGVEVPRPRSEKPRPGKLHAPGAPDGRESGMRATWQGIELKASQLEVGEEELHFMAELAPILGRSPRTVKRFINTYRLLKAMTPDLSTFLLDAGPVCEWKSVMVLLAVVTGMPLISIPVLETLMNPNTLLSEAGDHAVVTLWSLIDSLRFSCPEEEAAAAQLKHWLEKYNKGTWKDVGIERFQIWASEVARFSFRVAPQ